MQLNTLKPKTKNRRTKRLGRSGNRGKTSGRGTKGQKARAGHRIRPEIRDLIKKLPKRRAYKKNGAKSVIANSAAQVVSVGELERFENGATVTASVLTEANLARRVSGKVGLIKILDGGELSKKLTVSGMNVSKGAREKIEKAGGTIK